MILHISAVAFGGIAVGEQWSRAVLLPPASAGGG